MDLSLALEHDARRCGSRSPTGQHPIFGSPDGESYEFRGAYFDVTKSVLEE